MPDEPARDEPASLRCKLATDQHGDVLSEGLDGVTEALLAGMAASQISLCLSDDSDRIRYANAAFRDAFCPQYDGVPARFMDVIGAAIRAGIGIKLASATPTDFIVTASAYRRDLIGSWSFATDLVDGSWWWITDTKLPSGWIISAGQNISTLKREEFVLRDAHAAAVAEAETDDLTGVGNRRHGLRRAEAVHAVSRAGHRDLAIAVIDIDHFKATNDQHGHDAGDRALVHFARFMDSALAPGEQFSRLGGDEFLFVSSGLLAVSAERRLALLLATLPPLVLTDRRIALRVSVSIGIAILRHEENWMDLLQRADAALYDAKASGRDRIALAV